MFTCLLLQLKNKTCWDAVGRGFAPQPSHTKNHHKNGIKCLPAWYTGIRVRV